VIPGSRGEHERPLSEINVTPLVDVMLVLLVIFIILAPVLARALRVDLPRVTAPPLVDPVVADLVLRLDGRLELDGEPLDEGQALERLVLRREAQPALVVRLGADAATPYQRVAQTLSLLREAGMDRIALATHEP
jgi:biopolymer transport protein ExbD